MDVSENGSYPSEGNFHVCGMKKPEQSHGLSWLADREKASGNFKKLFLQWMNMVHGSFIDLQMI